MGDRFWQVSPAVRNGIDVLLGTQSGHIACRSLRLSFCPVRTLLRLPGALGRAARGTQRLFQDARYEVFSVREEVRSATR